MTIISVAVCDECKKRQDLDGIRSWPWNWIKIQDLSPTQMTFAGLIQGKDLFCSLECFSAWYRRQQK